MGKRPRFAALQPDEMNPAQRALFAEIASGPRGGVNGPFRTLLHHPELASAVQRLADVLRFHRKLPEPLAELGVIIAARRWSSQYIWHRHAQFAAEAGVSPAIIEAIAQRRLPSDMSQDEKTVYDVCTEIHATGRLSDEAFERAAESFGREGVLELIALCGHYSLIAFVLNVADDPLPNNAAPQLREAGETPQVSDRR